MARKQPRVGIALDSGGAIGGAHIGVLEVLAENGIPLDIIVGSSAGAAIGAFFAANKLVSFKELITDLSFIESLSYYADPVFPTSGLLAGSRARKFIHGLVGDTLIEDLPLKFVAVATDLLTGETVAIDYGPLADALMASISMPGIFKPVVHHGRLLTDGGVSNPLPLDVLKSFSPDITIACNLHPRISSRFTSAKRRDIIQAEQKALTGEEEDLASWIIDRITGLLVSQKIMDGLKPLTRGLLKKINASRTNPKAELYLARVLKEQLMQSKDKLGALIARGFSKKRPHDILNIFEILATATNIQQYQKNRLMLLYEPPDVLIEPNVTGISSIEFTKSAWTIDEGRNKTLEAIPKIKKLIKEKKKTISRAGDSPS
jgi:NTE family protein